MSTFTDGNPSPAVPEPDHGSGSAWLDEEIRRRVAAGGAGSGGRHARPDAAAPITSTHVPRHSAAPDVDHAELGTPGPTLPRPAEPRGPGGRRPGAPDDWRGPPGGPVRGDRNGSAAHPPLPAPAPPGDLAPPAPPPAPPRSTVAVPAQREPDQLGGGHAPRPVDPASGNPDSRVRVVLAERKRVAKPVRTVVDIQEGTGVGELLRNDLIGSQLRVALRFAAGAALTIGLLPLLFALVPAIGRIDVLGLGLPWLLLGILVYPYLLGLSWWHTVTAERVEQNFADYVQD